MEKNYKYPFIKGGKAMVAAVLGACSYIRETGYFNKAVRYYSEKYDVDPDELEKNIRARQAAGQRSKSTAGRTYKYFIVARIITNDANYNDIPYRYDIVRGISEKTVKARFTESDWNNTTRNYTGSSYDPCYEHKIIGEYATKQEAEEALDKIERETKDDRNTDAPFEGTKNVV